MDNIIKCKTRENILFTQIECADNSYNGFLLNRNPTGGVIGITLGDSQFESKLRVGHHFQNLWLSCS